MDTIKQIINKFDIISKKSLGQNYILDQNITNKILRKYNLKDKVILEIGPGPGCLTRSLINSNVKKVIAIEKDKRCIEALEHQKKDFRRKLVLIYGDILKQKTFDNITKEIRKTKKKVMVVANLPYNIAIHILSKLLFNRKLFSMFVLMFQEEQANRIMANKETKEYGRISVYSQWLCNIKKNIHLSPNYFFPKPRVHSTVLEFKFKEIKKEICNEYFFLEVIKKSFNQRRKTIKNNLKSNKFSIEEILKKNKIIPTKRPEDLSVNDFINLTNSLYLLK